MVLHSQTAVTPQVADSTKPYTLAPVVVSVTRRELPLAKIPLSIQSVDRDQIGRARPTWGLDEALVTVPGVFVANRYNFSQDQRISIRGFGARSAFAPKILSTPHPPDHVSVPIPLRPVLLPRNLLDSSLRATPGSAAAS